MEIKNGITIITCSINPESCNKMLESIKRTIGVDYELIVFDNREKKLGICQVYNHCAQKAKFPYLCFIHEDVTMPTPNWGKTMITFAEATPDCGIIGFAGGAIANKNFISWWCGSKGRYRYYDHDHTGKAKRLSDLSYKYNNPENKDFDKVVTLDGVFLLVSKEVWQANPFDEKNYKGFHFYDADFSFCIGQTRQNYVCLVADIYHFSAANINKMYYENARIFQKKWRKALPKTIGSKKINMLEEINNAHHLLWKSIEYGYTITDCFNHFLKINGLLYFLAYCLFLPLKVGGRLIKKIKQKILRNMHST
jgi:hypothetical protein